MKFISELLLGIIKSVSVAVILGALALSLIQKKFPPSLSEAGSVLESVTKLVQMNSALNTDKHNLDSLLKNENLITNREKIIQDLDKFDGTVVDVQPEPKNAKSIADTSKRDLAMLKIRLEQSEYKIRLLEYELKQLKDEYRKIRR